jgi:hypothetical protein
VETRQADASPAKDAPDRRHGPSVEDGRLGRIAYFAGWLTFDQIALCLQRQHEAAEAGGKPPRFGEVAVSLGFLTERQVRALLRIQAIHDNPTAHEDAIGALAVRQGMLSLDDLDDALETQKKLLLAFQDSPKLGAILVEQRKIESDQVKALLEVQAERGRGPAAQQAEDPTRERLMCLCRACGRAVVRDSASLGDPCADCGSEEVEAVPYAGHKAHKALSRNYEGPSIEDSRLGRIAYFAGWMTLDQVRRCLEVQRKTVQWGGAPPRFGEVAVYEGILTQEQVNALLRIQAVHRSPKGDRAFGSQAVRRGWITQQQLDECLADQERLLREKRDAPSLGLLLIEKGLLTEGQVKTILRAQSRPVEVHALRRDSRRQSLD